jgi:hypothetical protein
MSWLKQFMADSQSAADSIKATTNKALATAPVRAVKNITYNAATHTVGPIMVLSAPLATKVWNAIERAAEEPKHVAVTR